jgi:hypothetical protein
VAKNFDYVLENGFGDYDRNPVRIGQKVTDWLQNSNLIEEMSNRSLLVGQPQAAEEIALDIGSITQTWKVLNGDVKGVTIVWEELDGNCGGLYFCGFQLPGNISFEFDELPTNFVVIML